MQYETGSRYVPDGNSGTTACVYRSPWPQRALPRMYPPRELSRGRVMLDNITLASRKSASVLQSVIPPELDR